MNQRSRCWSCSTVRLPMWETAAFFVARALLVMCAALGKRTDYYVGHSDRRFIMKILRDGKRTEKKMSQLEGSKASESKGQCPWIAMSVAQHICRWQGLVMMSKV